MSDTTTQPKDGFGVLGIGAAACVACCSPLILAFLGGLGFAATFWFGAVGLAAAAVVAVSVLVIRRKRQPAVTAAAT